MLDLRPSKLSKPMQDVLLRSDEWGGASLTSASVYDLHSWLELSIGLQLHSRPGSSRYAETADVIEATLDWLVAAVEKSRPLVDNDVTPFLVDYLHEQAFSVAELVEQLKLLGAGKATVEESTIETLASALRETFVEVVAPGLSALVGQWRSDGNFDVVRIERERAVRSKQGRADRYKERASYRPPGRS